MSSNQDLIGIIQAKLSSGETASSCHEASLMQGWVRASRILALVEHENEWALFIFISSRMPPEVFTDLAIERVIPVDSDFKCEIDAGEQSGDVYVNISSRKLKLLFEMIPGIKTNNFVSEIMRSMEALMKLRGPPPEFQWLHKYSGSTSNRNSADCDPAPVDAADVDVTKGAKTVAEKMLDIDSPDIVVPRQSIAQGATPIAARESVIRYQMSMKEDDYTFTETLRVFIGTWNVNGLPPNASLSPWLASDMEPPDLYAVGFQELDLSKEAFLFNDTPREEEWRKAVIAGLHPAAKYRQVALVRLVGMMLILLVQEKHEKHVRNVAWETVGTGIMGKMGNKGGVGIRVEIHNTSICFVNSHLAAHVEEFERRNQDYHDICSRLSFSKFVPTKCIKDHDQVYWLGDLNYRITEMEPRIVRDLISHNSLSALLECDQLNRQRQHKNVFDGYREGPITFKPTYKYDPGTDDWDSSEKNRAPAWCDRILWRGDGMEQKEYRSHPILRTSDHKPVSALFESQIRVIDVVKYRKVHEEVMKKLDKLENEFLPQVTVDNTEIIFDIVRFLEPQSQELIIANTGQVPVDFEFIKKLDDSKYCKEWLNIDPAASSIKPGEKCDVKLELFVDKKSASKLNSGEDKLYDILVLHLDGGKDIFITVTGNYERSCFGSSLEALVHISVPVREIPIGKLVELENVREAPGGMEPYPIPKEIWFLVDHLYRHGLKKQNLFLLTGLHSELIAIRNWLDNGSSEPLPGSLYSIAEALLLLLESTAEPIVPFNLHSVCLGAATNYLQCKQIIMQLPEFRRNVFLYLCFFLQELLSHANENGLDAKTLATVFGAIFLRDPPRVSARGRVNPAVMDRKKASFVYHFLVNDLSDYVMSKSLHLSGTS
ncbi:hypothetical protein ONE63_006771 [Megalurothrips usitatus]|uniref:phosphoinositide 5-phosphatase n=1 Tax=Megalurothrips usitatus TaxID=439358 RepID=A0AAV7XWB8_9NEOP|nr:hypothetical protein ONE63_006771 [Megalurothrips usitatus]